MSLRRVSWTTYVSIDCLELAETEVEVHVKPARLAEGYDVVDAIYKWSLPLTDTEQYTYVFEYDDLQVAQPLVPEDIIAVTCKRKEEKAEIYQIHHSGVPIYDESDPYFNASPAATITQADINNWNLGGGGPETDPLWAAWLAGPPNISEFTNDAGYLTAWGPELDPVFAAWYAGPPNVSEFTNDAGYITAWGPETDPVFAAWYAGPPNISEFTNDAGYLTAWGPETDPVFAAWYAGPPNVSEFTNDAGYITAWGPETDPVFAAWYAGPPNISEFTNDVGYITAWGPETDPVFAAWYAGPPNVSEFMNDAGYISSWGPETDPVFSAWLGTSPLSGYVPYVGATTNVNLGNYNLTCTTGNAKTIQIVDATVTTAKANFTSSLTVQDSGSGIAYAGLQSEILYYHLGAGLTTIAGLYGHNITVLRNSIPAGIVDSGTIASIIGETITYGHSVMGVGTPQTTDAYGIYLQPYNLSGSITNLYNLYLGDVAGSAPTNHYAIYQEATAATNYFASRILQPDNVKHIFGTGSDASIYYNGTNLLINPKEVGVGILDVIGTVQTDGYNAADGTAGASATPSGLTFKNGLYTAGTITGYVPYVGATADVNLGLFDLEVTEIVAHGDVTIKENKRLYLDGT